MQLCNLSLNGLDLGTLYKLNMLDNISKAMSVVSRIPFKKELKMHRVNTELSQTSLYGIEESKSNDNENDVENDPLFCSKYSPFTQLTNENKIRFSTLVFRGLALLKKLFLYEATNLVGTHYDEKHKIQ